MIVMSVVNSVTRRIVILFPVVAVISTLPLLYETFADHGQEISLALNSAEFKSLSSNKTGHQVRVFVNYTINDPSLIGQTINSVMKVYSLNGTLLKTSSSPNGFTINSTGIQRHSTTLADNTIQNVTAVVQFTDISKITPMSNPVSVKLNLANSTAVTLVKKPEIASLPPPLSPPA
jgi:hypothetical protein